MALLNKDFTAQEVKSEKNSVETLNQLIVEAIQNVKGNDISVLDLRNTHDAPTDFFIICHGNSDTQVKAIAGNIAKEVKQKTGEYPSHTEGVAGGTWALVDYFTTVVHIFHKEARAFYNLEALWSDAKVTEYENL
ncbi:MAG: ribosome silencing factor [Saprospiraceae bacterium]